MDEQMAEIRNTFSTLRSMVEANGNEAGKQNLPEILVNEIIPLHRHEWLAAKRDGTLDFEPMLRMEIAMSNAAARSELLGGAPTNLDDPITSALADYLDAWAVLWQETETK